MPKSSFFDHPELLQLQVRAMKKLIVAALLIVSASLAGQTPASAQAPAASAAATPRGGAAQAEPASNAKKLTRAEFDKLLANPSQLLLIDVRRPDEVAAIGGFPVYLAIPLGDLEKSLAWIPKDRAIVTISNHAARGGRAADLLAKHGFKVAGTVGAQNYESEGGTLFKPQPPKTAAASVDPKK
jgi:rhodanese-related sulfurtransferase